MTLAEPPQEWETWGKTLGRHPWEWYDRPLPPTPRPPPHLLDDVLGTPVTVRALRVFCGNQRVLWPSEVAVKASISRTSAWKAIQRLAARGIIEPLHFTYARSVPYQLWRPHGVVQPLVALFSAETSWERT